MNWTILFIAIVAGISENIYFGWNITPKSDSEMVCDLIVLAILAMAAIKP